MERRRTAAERARARAAWPGRVRDMTAAEDELVGGTAAERIAMVWQLTLDAWAMSGRPLPTYARHEAPGRKRRLGDE